MQWKNFTLQGVVYELDHLHPFSFDLAIPAKDGKPALSYKINVAFSLHCFSRGAKPGEAIPAGLAYGDSRETRIFDPDRHGQSLQLPEIVRTLGEKPCFHDNHGKFYVFEVIQDDGTTRYYSVFFTLSKAGRKTGLNLYVSSAHMRNERPYSRNVKSIKFRVIVHNTWIGRALRPAPQRKRLPKEPF